MVSQFRFWIGLTVVMLAAAVCAGEVEVKKGGVSPPASEAEVTNTGGKFQVNFYGAASGQYVISAGPTDVIEYIRSVANNSVEIFTSLAAIPLRIEEIKRTGGTGTLAIGSVEAESHIGPASRVNDTRIIVNAVSSVLRSRTGNLHCGILIEPSSAFVTQSLEALELPNGQLLGNITNTTGVNGRINGILCQSVNGTATEPVVITSNGRVESVQVNGAANHFKIVDPAVSRVNRTLTIAGPVTVSDSWVGEISTANFADVQPGGGSAGAVFFYYLSTVSIGEDFTGTIDATRLGFQPSGLFEPFFPFRSFASIRIGRTLTAGSTISMPKYEPSGAGIFVHGGLQSQVVIDGNHLDSAPGTGRMDGDVVFVPSSGPATVLEIERDIESTRGQYSTIRSELGYGSVGVMPYGLHGSASRMYTVSEGFIVPVGGTMKRLARGPFSPAASDPPNSSVNVPFVGYPELLNFRMSFYGPVFGGRTGEECGQDEEPEAEFIWEFKRADRQSECWQKTSVGFKVQRFFAANDGSPRDVELLGALAIPSSEIANPPQPISNGDPPFNNWTPFQTGVPQTLRNSYIYRLRTNTSNGVEDLPLR